MPGRKLTPSAELPDHQSHAVLPGLIHDVSAMADGGFRLITIFDSTSRPGCALIRMTRHGDRTGVAALTAIAGSPLEGASRENRDRASRPECVRYMPA